MEKKLIHQNNLKALRYNANTGSLQTTAYQSKAGNVYFGSANASDKLLIYEDIGVGYKHRFLNGVILFALDENKKPHRIGNIDLHCVYYTKQNVEEYATQIIMKSLQATASENGNIIADTTIVKRVKEAIYSTNNPTRILI
jgi:hypothetical protein